jgi:hypothetical protein
VATGKTNKEVGRALGISDRTVSTTLSAAYQRLDLTSRGQLSDWMRHGGLLDGHRGGLTDAPHGVRPVHAAPSQALTVRGRTRGGRSRRK